MTEQMAPFTKTERSVLATALGRAASTGAHGGHPDDGVISRYLSRELDDREREAFERHMAGCAQCAEDLVASAAVEQETADEAGMAPAAANVAGSEKVTSIEAAREARRPKRRTARRLAVAGTIAAGLAGLLLGGERLLLQSLQPQVIARLEALTGREIQIEDSSLMLVGGPGVRLAGLRIADDPRFAIQDLLHAEEVRIEAYPGDLIQGRFHGGMHIERPTLQLVRGTSGHWNVETLGGRDLVDEIERLAEEEAKAAPAAAGTGAALGGDLPEPDIHLARATIEQGTLAIVDHGPGGTEEPLVIERVDLAYQNPNPEGPGDLRLAGTMPGSATETERSVAIEGRVGPFGRAADPRYDLSKIELARVVLERLPGAPDDLRGDLSFDGSLKTAGTGLRRLVRTARGSGTIELAAGVIERRNLADDLLVAFGSQLEESGWQALDRAVAASGIVATLDAPRTSYGSIGGAVAIEPGRLTFADLGIRSELFDAWTDGQVALDGNMKITGEVDLGPELSQILVAAAPAIDALLEDGRLTLPFQAIGTWPDVEVGVEVEPLLARVTAAWRFALFRRPPLPRG